MNINYILGRKASLFQKDIALLEAEMSKLISSVPFSGFREEVGLSVRLSAKRYLQEILLSLMSLI